MQLRIGGEGHPFVLSSKALLLNRFPAWDWSWARMWFMCF